VLELVEAKPRIWIFRLLRSADSTEQRKGEKEFHASCSPVSRAQFTVRALLCASREARPLPPNFPRQAQIVCTSWIHELLCARPHATAIPASAPAPIAVVSMTSGRSTAREHVGLKLHEPAVFRGAAINAQHVDRCAARRAHCRQYVGGTEAHRLECGAHEMLGVVPRVSPTIVPAHALPLGAHPSVCVRNDCRAHARHHTRASRARRTRGDVLRYRRRTGGNARGERRTVDVLRVDGGARKQLAHAVSGRRARRARRAPDVIETTAMGAGALAGIAVGVCERRAVH